MVEICDVEKIYMGTEPVSKIYTAPIDPFIDPNPYLVWPCYTCVELPPEDPNYSRFSYFSEDSEYATPFYDEAILYIPKVCAPAIAQKDWAPFRIRDAWPNVELPQLAGYNNVYEVADVSGCYGFEAPDAPKYNQLITEEDSIWVIGFGINQTCGISFFITNEDALAGTDVDGTFIELDGLQISLVGYEDFPPTIKVRAERESPFFPIELTADEFLPIGTEVHVTVNYELVVGTLERLRIYFDNDLVGEYTV